MRVVNFNNKTFALLENSEKGTVNTNTVLNISKMGIS
ncbi:MAG: hypothetical protein ACI956_002445 [Nonlabens sp.]|jgi:hypothetical protein